MHDLAGPCSTNVKEETMDRREFIAVAGAVAAAAAATEAFAAEEPMMHAPKYKALEQAAADCVATGNDCLRHCLGMYAMKDTSMAGWADAAFPVGPRSCAVVDA